MHGNPMLVRSLYTEIVVESFDFFNTPLLVLIFELSVPFKKAPQSNLILSRSETIM